MTQSNKTRCDVFRVLYKKTDSPGWNYAQIWGDQAKAEMLCRRLKQERDWYSYEIFHDGTRCKDSPEQTVFIEAAPGDDNLHMRTALIHTIWDDKYYFQDEIIPYPDYSNKKTTRKLTVSVALDEDNTSSMANEETEVVIKIDKVEILTVAEWLLDDLPRFRSELEERGYSIINIEEYWYHKILAWKVGNKVRLIILCTGNEIGKIVLDKLLPVEIFMGEFSKLAMKLRYFIDKQAKHPNN